MAYASASSFEPARDPALVGVNRRRLAAWVIDSAIIAVLTALILPVTAFTGLFAMGGIWLVTGFLYRWAAISAGSATWGMAVAGLTFIEWDGGPLRPETALWHTAIYSLAMAMAPLQLFSIALMVLTPTKRSLSDAVLGTRTLRR